MKPVFRTLHTRLRMAGHEPTSSWAEEANGPEDLASLTPGQCGAIWDRNDQDMGEPDYAIRDRLDAIADRLAARKGE